MNSEWTITSILNRLEDLTARQVYKYNKQECINSKPSLSAGNEELKEYDCNLKLHASFCNPSRVIDLLKKRQESREPFEWLYRGAYKGSFVIENFEEREISRIKDVLIAAEISFTLLENPLTEDFQQQITGAADFSGYEQFSDNSNRLKEFAASVKNSITENLKETIANAALSENISDAAKEIFENVKNGVINDIESGSIANIYDTARNYAEKINRAAAGADGSLHSLPANLETSDLKELITSVSALPSMIMRAAV